jgi:hypothetical protein
VDNALLAEALGMNGRVFYRQHYDWPVIERKYLAMLESLKAEDAAGMPAREVAPLPGWLARRRRVLPPARDILAQIPTGPVLS